VAVPAAARSDHGAAAELARAYGFTDTDGTQPDPYDAP
jgi:hypothetical protein